MGLPMALRLQKAGYPVWGFDIRPSEQFSDFAPRMLNSAAELAHRCDVVISVVRDHEQTEQMLFGDSGLVLANMQCQTLILSSTLDPNYVRALPPRLPASLCLLDAPMSGAPIAAERGSLSFMLSGDTATLDALKPIFSTMGRHFHRLGHSVGAGHTAKVLNNFSAAMSVVVTRQLMEIGTELGIERGQLFDVMNSSSGQNWFSSGFDDISWSRQGYVHENTIGILEKDVNCFAQAVEDLASDELIELKHALLINLKTLKPIN